MDRPDDAVELANIIVSGKGGRRTTKELIYEKALRLFAERGYASTGLRDIAQEVGIEVASLYTHIQSKRELLFDLMDFGTRDLLERLSSAASNQPNPCATLYSLVYEHVRINCGRQAQTLVAFNEIRELNDAERSKIFPLREAIESLYIEAIAKGISVGCFREVDVRVASHAILAMERGVAVWFRDGGPLSAEEIGAQFADTTVRGLLMVEIARRLPDQALELTHLHDLDIGQ